MESMNKTKIKEVLLKAIQERVKDGFDRSQAVVPVVTGNLKRSGKEEDIENGAKLEYKIEYSSFVERGMPAHYEHVDSFFRKDGVFVKGFTRYMKERKPRNFIRNSLKAAFERFPSSFDSNLREKFKRVNWK